MDSTVFRAALRASARVTLTAAIASCGGAIRSTADRGADGSTSANPAPDADDPLDPASLDAALDEPTPLDATALFDGMALAEVKAPSDDATLPDAIGPTVTDADTADAAPLPTSCQPPLPASLLPAQAHADAGVADGVLSCCVVRLESIVFRDAGVSTVDGDSVVHDPETLGCCAVAINHLDRRLFQPRTDASPSTDPLLDAGITWWNLHTCCAAVGYPAGPTCAPWGPPMPPAMPVRGGCETARHPERMRPEVS
jgi:hypothetical protein